MEGDFFYWSYVYHWIFSSVHALIIIVKSAKTVYLLIFPYTLNLDPVCLTESWCNIEKIKIGWCKGSGITLMLEGGAAYFFNAELLRNRTVFQGDWKNSSRWNLKLKLSKSDLVGGGCCADGFQRKNLYFFYYTHMTHLFEGSKCPKNI